MSILNEFLVQINKQVVRSGWFIVSNVAMVMKEAKGEDHTWIGKQVGKWIQQKLERWKC
jgi:hypothetical protein